LEPDASTFVVFRDRSAPLPATENKLVEEMPSLLDLTGSWNVQFTPGWGAPAQVTFPKLQSWTLEDDPGIRNYSGTATYTQSFDYPAVPSGKRIVLDLGEVDVIASVKLNNKDLGTVWKAPYALDVTSSLVPGTNTLQIRVANLWANRLIGDAGLPEAERKTWTTGTPYHPTDPLLPSGLLGPVRLLRAQ
jgi:beta-galactosidase/beta-glucuronidase